MTPNGNIIIAENVMLAIEHDNVNILRTTFDWIGKVTNVGLPIFSIINDHNAAKCLTEILTHCPKLDPTVKWIYNRDAVERAICPITSAISAGHVELTAVYLEHANVTIKHFTRQLFTCCLSDDHVDMLRLFIDHRPAFNLNVDCSEAYHLTMLMITAQLGYCRMTQLLVDASTRVDIDAVDVEGESALCYATYYQHPKCVQILLNGQASTTTVCNSAGISTDSNPKELIIKLIKQSLIQKLSRPNDIVHLSDEVYDRLKFMVTLESALANNSVDILTKPFNWAEEMTIRLCHPRGIETLHILTLSGRHEMLDAIFTHCGPFPVNAEQQIRGTVLTPFQYAVRYGSAEAVRVLLKHAAARFIDITRQTCYIRQVDQIGWVCGPMMLAVESEKLDVLEVLINHPNIDVNAMGKWLGSDKKWCTVTPLLTAIGGPRQTPIPYHERRAKFVKLLLTDDRIDVNIKDDQSHTALMYAVMQNDVELVGMLLTDHTDLSAKTRTGKTAAHLATSKIKRMIRDFAAARRRRVKQECTNENVKSTTKVNDTDTKRQATIPQPGLTQQTTSNKNHASKLERINGETKLKLLATSTSTTTTPAATVITKAKEPTIRARNHTIDHACQQCRSTKCAVNTVLQPCNHLAMCQNCVDVARKNKRFKCPICKQRVMKYVRVFL